MPKRSWLVWVPIAGLAWSACVSAPSQQMQVLPVTLVTREVTIVTLPPPTSTPTPRPKPTATLTPGETTTREPSETPTSTPTPLPAEPIARLAPGEPIVITNIHMIDGSQGWAIGGSRAWWETALDEQPDVWDRLEGDHVFHTADGGKTWSEVTPPEPAARTAGGIKPAYGGFLDARTGWVLFNPSDEVSEQASVWRTKDGGRSWQRSSPLGPSMVADPFFQPAIQFDSAGDRGWLLGQSGGAATGCSPFALYWTVNGGVDWQLVDDMGCNSTGIAFAGSSLVWITADSGAQDGVIPLEVIRDGASTWEDENLPLPAALSAIDEFYCQTGSPALFSEKAGALAARCTSYDTSSTGETTSQEWAFLFTTTDGGNRWRSQAYPGGKLVFLDRSTAWAEQTYPFGGKIYQTRDGGSTWTSLSSVSWFGQFSFVRDWLGWAVARKEGAIAFVQTFDAGRTWVELEPRVGP